MMGLVHLLSDRSLQAVHHPNQNYFPLPRRPQPPPTKHQANLPHQQCTILISDKISAQSISSQDHGKSAPSPRVGPLSFFCADAANRSKLSQTTPFLSLSVIFFVTLPELVLEDLVLATQFLPPSEHVTPTSLDHHFPKRRRRYESPSFVEGENPSQGTSKSSLFHMASPSWLALFLGWEEIRTQLYSTFHRIHNRVFRPSLAASSDAGVDSEFFLVPSKCCPKFASLTHHHNFWHTVENAEPHASVHDSLPSTPRSSTFTGQTQCVDCPQNPTITSIPCTPFMLKEMVATWSFFFHRLFSECVSLVVESKSSVVLLGYPRASVFAASVHRWVLTGTHRCALMPWVASRQSAHSMWLVQS